MGIFQIKFVSAAELKFMLQTEESVEPDRTILIDTLLSVGKKMGENNNEVKSIISEFNLYDKYNLITKNILITLVNRLNSLIDDPKTPIEKKINDFEGDPKKVRKLSQDVQQFNNKYQSMPIITKSDKKKVSKGETLHDDFEDDFSEKVRKLSRDNQQSNNRYQLLPKTGEVSNKGWLGGLL